jgi:hypothetical protein
MRSSKERGEAVGLLQATLELEEADAQVVLVAEAVARGAQLLDLRFELGVFET